MSFDDDFRRLGGKEVHVVTADVPGAAEFDRTHPNTIHRLQLGRVPWLKPESALMYSKLFLKACALAVTHRFVAIFAGRALPEGLVAWAVARLTGRPVLIYAHGEELTGWGTRRKIQGHVLRVEARRCAAGQQRFHARNPDRSDRRGSRTRRAHLSDGGREPFPPRPRGRRPARRDRSRGRAEVDPVGRPTHASQGFRQRDSRVAGAEATRHRRPLRGDRHRREPRLSARVSPRNSA